MYNKPITNKNLEEIRKIGLKALREKLGPVGMIKFLQMYSDGKGDYTMEKYQMLNDTSIEDFEDFIDEE